MKPPPPSAAPQQRGVVERGATLADVSQGGDVSWTVLLNPEGNEFCLLPARDL